MTANLKNKELKVVFLFKENLETEIPESALADNETVFICESSEMASLLPKGRAYNWEQIAGLDGLMKSTWNQIEWLKRWGTETLENEKSFIELYSWRELPLWYFGELFLHYPKKLLRIITIIDIFNLIQGEYGIKSITLINSKLTPVRVLIKAAMIAGIPAFVEKGKGSTSYFHGWKSFKEKYSPWISAKWYVIKQFISICFMKLLKPAVWKKIKDYVYDGTTEPDSEKKVCLVSHGSYWRTAPPGYEGKSRQLDMYWDRLIDEMRDETDRKNSSIALIGAGPRSIHRRRNGFVKLREFFLPFGDRLPYAPFKCFSDFSTWNRTRKGSNEILRKRRQFIKNPELEKSITYKGINFFDEVSTDLKRMFILMLPWGIKIIEQAVTAFETLQPDVVCQYAEAGGYGRAITYAAKVLGIKTVAIQHGLIFPHNYTYVHTKAEMEGKYGTPYPFTDRFLLYDRFVKKLLEEYGNYPSKTLLVTGGHKMDNLLRLKESVDTKAVKKELGYDTRDRFAVIASRFSEIGTAFPSIVKAVEAIPRMHLVVKPHQAELPEYYTDIADKLGAKKVRVVSNKENLFRLLLASDVLITVNSLAALEALVVGKPVMVVNLPNHLSVYVDSGIALGVESHADILVALRETLFANREELLKKQEQFSRDNAFMTDGNSGERIKTEIYAAAFSK